MVVHNLQRARQKWARMTRVLIREGAYALTSVHIYLEVVQLVMSYRLDTWFMSPYMERVWGWFHVEDFLPRGRFYRVPTVFYANIHYKKDQLQSIMTPPPS